MEVNICGGGRELCQRYIQNRKMRKIYAKYMPIVVIHWIMRLWGTFYFLLDYSHVFLNLNEYVFFK